MRLLIAVAAATLASLSGDTDRVTATVTVSLASHGRDAVVTLEATLGNGVSYKGTMLCVDVSRN